MKLFPIICVGSVFWKQAQHCSQDFDKKKERSEAILRFVGKMLS